MTDNDLINNACPLCVNVQRLANYLLAPDEVILFDWLVIKQSVVFDFAPFFYSQKRIEKETRIKRRTLERIVKRFCAMGILSTETKGTDGGGRGNNNTYYRVSFADVVQRLPEIIDTTQKDTAKAFNAYFAALARLQSRADKGTRTKTTTKQEADGINAEQYYRALCDVWRNRVQMYNNGKLTEEAPDLIKIETALPRTATTAANLARLADVYDLESVKCAFVAFADDVLRGIRRPRNALAAFLTYDKQNKLFTAVSESLEKFIRDYSQKR